MALNSSDVNAGDDILATHNNNLIDDIEQHTHEGTDTTKVKVENIDVSTGDLGADSVPDSALKAGAVGATKLGTGATYNGTITRILSLAPAAFVPNTESAGYDTTKGSLASDSVATLNAYAGINLPHGAIVTDLVMWGSTPAVGSVTVSLNRNALASDTNAEMASAAITNVNGSDTATDNTISDATIDNENYEYVCQVTLAQTATLSALFGVRIKYTIVAPLP